MDKTANDMIYVERDDELSRQQVEDKLIIIREAIEDGGQDAVRDAVIRTVPSFRLPKEINDKAMQAKQMQVINNTGSTARKTILVVDDTKLNRAILHEILVEDYAIVEAANGQEALDILDSNNDVSLVLLDIYMPVMDGFKVLEQMRMRGLLPGMPVIVISAETEQEYVKRSYEMGAKEYLARPFDFVIVRQRVKNVISLASDKVTA